MSDIEQKRMEEAEETGFNEEMILEFYKRGGKMLSRFRSGPNTGKYILPNRTEDVDKIIEGMPYRCMVKNSDDCGAAFAKIISQVFVPRIIIRKGFVIVTLKKKDDIEHIAVPSLRKAQQLMIEHKTYKWITIIQTNDYELDDNDNIKNIDINELWKGK